MTINPTVSVCIANFNGVSIIASCLDSVLRQQGNIPIEIIVHDDASTDASVGFMRKNYPDISIIESKENVGFCVANNRMAAIARGDYLLLLNNDATLFPDALSTLLAKAEEISQPAILGLPQYDADTGKLLDMGSLFDPILNPIPNLDPEINDVGMIMGACLWIPKKLWEKLGGFPEWFGSIGEDLYLCCLARLWGHNVTSINHSGYYHTVGYSFGGGKVISGKLQTSKKRRNLTERNKTYVLIMISPLPFLIALLPVHLLFLFLEACALAILKWDRSIFTDIYLPGYTEVWRQRRKILMLRASIQNRRRCKLFTLLSVFRLTPYKLRLFIKYGVPQLK